MESIYFPRISTFCYSIQHVLSCNAPTYDTASHVIWMLFITYISLNQSREAQTFTLCICMIFAKFCHAKMKTIQNVIIYKLIFTSHLYNQVYKYIVQYHNKGLFTNTCKGGGLMQKKKFLLWKILGTPLQTSKMFRSPSLPWNYGSIPLKNM